MPSSCTDHQMLCLVEIVDVEKISPPITLTIALSGSVDTRNCGPHPRCTVKNENQKNDVKHKIR